MTDISFAAVTYCFGDFIADTAELRPNSTVTLFAATSSSMRKIATMT